MRRDQCHWPKCRNASTVRFTTMRAGTIELCDEHWDHLCDMEFGPERERVLNVMVRKLEKEIANETRRTVAHDG